jgi:hypothetical protein
MIIYIDENLPSQLAEGLNKLQEPPNRRNNTNYEIKSIKTVFGLGVKDEEWIPKAGEEKAVAITRDFKIQTTRHQKELCEDYGLGIFFFKSDGIKYWDIVKNLINKWEDLLKTIETSKAPYAYRFSVRSKKFDKLDE